jgi:hypothetical protein
MKNRRTTHKEKSLHCFHAFNLEISFSRNRKDNIFGEEMKLKTIQPKSHSKIERRNSYSKWVQTRSLWYVNALQFHGEWQAAERINKITS